MARIGFRHPKAFKQQLKVQKKLDSNFFDLKLSIGTKNNFLWTIILALLAAKRWRQKIKIFNQKNIKILNFWIYKSYIP